MSCTSDNDTPGPEPGRSPFHQCRKEGCIYAAANATSSQCPFHQEQKRLLNCMRTKNSQTKQALKDAKDRLSSKGKREYNETRGCWPIRGAAASARNGPEEEIFLQCTPQLLCVLFHNYLTGPHRKANSARQITTWLKFFEHYTIYVASTCSAVVTGPGHAKTLASESVGPGESAATATQTDQKCSLQDLLQTIHVQAYIERLQSIRQKRDFTEMMTKISAFKESQVTVCNQASLKSMTQALTSQMKSKSRSSKKSSAKNNISLLRAQNKWPATHDPDDFSNLRDTIIRGLMKAVKDLKPKMEALLQGSSMKQHRLSVHERKVLSGFLMTLISLDGKPCRPINLKKLTCEDVAAWKAAPDGLFIVTEEKQSCSNDTTEIPATPLIKEGLDLHVDLIRPVLVQSGTLGKPERYVQEVDQRDVQLASSIKERPADKQHLFSILHAGRSSRGDVTKVKRAPNYWDMVFQLYPPEKNGGKWYTRNLTAEALRSAYNASEFNEALFVDHNGNSGQGVDLGGALAYITKEFAGVEMNATALRKIVTTVAKERSPGDLEVTDSALEHTAGTSAKFYQLNDRHQKVQTFVKGYSLSLKNTRAPGPEGAPAPMEEHEKSDSDSEMKMADAANMSADSHHDHDFELGHDSPPAKTPPDNPSEPSSGAQSESSECEDSELGPEYSESDFEAEPNRKKKKLKIKHQESPPLRSFANLTTCTRPLLFSLRSHTISVRMLDDPSKKITEEVAKRLLSMLQL